MVEKYVIVGGGMYGCGTAWELVRRGADVTLLEAEEVASGASGGLGMRGVRANGRDPRELPLMERAYEKWENLADEIGGETGFEQIGHLQLYEKRDYGLSGGFESASARQYVQDKKGVPTERLEAKAVRELEPEVSEDVVGALYCPCDGVADHTTTTQNLARAAEREGADVREETPVTEARVNSDEVTAVVTADGETVPVDGELILLSNVHTVEFVDEQFGVRLPACRVFPQVVMTEPRPDVQINQLIGHNSRRLALKIISDDRVMISGGWRGTWNAEDEQSEPIPDDVRRNIRQAEQVFPSLKGVEVAGADVSRPETVAVDRIPIVDRLRDPHNVLVGTGWSGHGFAISPAVTELLAEWVTTGTKPSLLEPFTLDRFLA